MVFAECAGRLESGVGANLYAAGDALLVGVGGERWSVSRDRFDTKYIPQPPTVSGSAGHYRNRPVRVLAKRMAEAFNVERSPGGDRLLGRAGDWMVQYAPGDFGIVAQDRFAAVYRLIE